MLVVNLRLPENAFHPLHFSQPCFHALRLLSVLLYFVSYYFVQTLNHFHYSLLRIKNNCRYKLVKVTRGNKTIAIPLCVDSILFISKLATFTCTLAEIKLFSVAVSVELSAIGLWFELFLFCYLY